MKKIHKAVLSAVAVGTVTAMAAPSMAADTVVQQILAGSRSASVTDLNLPNITYSHEVQTSTGSMTLTAQDATGTGLGWNVTVQSSDFAYSGSDGGSSIPASNLSLTSAATPVVTAGQVLDALAGPMVPLISPVGSLDVARKTTQALLGAGDGIYTQSLGVSLRIPAQSKPGIYTGTLTTTIAVGP